MAYVGYNWALLANHQIWSYSGRCNMYFQVYAWSEQDAINNRSTVHTRTRILVENLNQSYSGYYVEQDWSAGVTGAPNYSAHATFSDGGAGTSKEYILQMVHLLLTMILMVMHQAKYIIGLMEHMQEL